MRARREPASSSTRLYRKRWYSELKARLGGASNLTPAIITALWQFSRDEHFVHPADPRRFPVVDTGWLMTFDVYILDPIITEAIFREMVEIAGMFIGIGRFRPEKGGTNGRFGLKELVWQDNRELVPLAA